MMDVLVGFSPTPAEVQVAQGGGVLTTARSESEWIHTVPITILQEKKRLALTCVEICLDKFAHIFQHTVFLCDMSFICGFLLQYRANVSWF